MIRPTNFDGINLQIQLLVFDQAVYPLGKDTLKIALARSATCVGRHHAGDWGICT